MMDRSEFLKAVRATSGLLLLGALFPETVLAQTVQIKRGPLASMPRLMPGQLAYATDLNLLFVGTDKGNSQIGGRWIFATASPDATMGCTSDWAVDASGMAWQKTASGWTQRCSLVGPAGPVGLPGKDGAPGLVLNREIVGVALPMVGIGLTKNVDVAWANPLPSTGYGVHYEVWPAPGITAALGVSVVPNSKTTTGCTLAVRALSALATNAATLDISIIHP